jgi:diguanylate cyclase (GGDEF)-like protein
VTQRDHAADGRDEAGDEHDQAGDQRDVVAPRDDAGDQRDKIAERRDTAARLRDMAGTERDSAGDQRDKAADERDKIAMLSEDRTSGGGDPEDALRRSAIARRAAASDRTLASLDRGAGANERSDARFDRDTAQADRGASAHERRFSSIDSLTGAYLRGAGLVELEREVARAKRLTEPLTIAFVDVDGLKAVNDLGGHAAGDRLLIKVVHTLAVTLRSYDLTIRFGGDEFVCVIPGLNIVAARKRLALVNAALSKAPDPGSVTVGLAELQADESPQDLIGRADASLYRERQHRSRLSG